MTDTDPGEDAEETEAASDLSVTDWAKNWISYAVGTVLGRFEFGQPGGLGCGDFSPETAAALRGLIDRDGVLVADEGHPDDLTAKVLAALELLLGHDGTADAIRAGTGSSGAIESALRKYLEKSFFAEHLRLYRKRPIYWYFQTPNKRYGLWIFHERLTRDTLYRIQTEYVEPRLRHSESRLKELQEKARLAETRERRALEKEASKEADLYDDLKEFHTRLKRIIDRGYTPHIDDGVLLNVSPLYEIFPAYPDCAKAWKDLMAGKYDWAQQAMEYRPEEVKEACKHNKSDAIAHGLA